MTAKAAKTAHIETETPAAPDLLRQDLQLCFAL